VAQRGFVVTPTSWLNALGVVSAVGLGLVGLGLAGEDKPVVPAASAVPETTLALVGLANGEKGLRDESGVVIPLRPYRRVVSASTISDALLLEFAAPEQIVAFTQYSGENEVFGYRYSGKPQVDALKNMEGLLALQPDLLLVSTLSSGARLERLRETGLTVFSLGEMRGVESYLRNARAIAALVGRAELGEMYAQSTLGRLQAIARDLPDAERKSAVQLTYYGTKIYGSGAQTSYTDVMRYAGLVDVAATGYTGWPAWSPEQVLELDPQVIVTRTGMGQQLCTQASLSHLRACQPGASGRSGIVELPDALINDPGPGMLLSAERIFAAVYGRR
jgi:ABC-type Fe3+-hydroxamate transport system substrate-binding protein